MSENGNGPTPEAELVRLRRQVEGLERRLLKFEALADATQRALIWDLSVYEVSPDHHWLAIDREDCERLLQNLAALDRWRPWSTVLESRLTDRM